MAFGVVLDGQSRAGFPFPTPPASDEGDDNSKRAGEARHGDGDSDDDGCVGCRKIAQNEVWRLQRQKKSMGESHWFLCVCVCLVRMSPHIHPSIPLSCTQYGLVHRRSRGSS